MTIETGSKHKANLTMSIARLMGRPSNLPHMGKARSWAPDEVGKEVQDAGEQRLDDRIELDHDVDHVLQALRAGLVQPGVHLRPPRLVRERRRVRHLRRTARNATARTLLNC